MSTSKKNAQGSSGFDMSPFEKLDKIEKPKTTTEQL